MCVCVLVISVKFHLQSYFVPFNCFAASIDQGIYEFDIVSFCIYSIHIHCNIWDLLCDQYFVLCVVMATLQRCIAMDWHFCSINSMFVAYGIF